MTTINHSAALISTLRSGASSPAKTTQTQDVGQAFTQVLENGLASANKTSRAADTAVETMVRTQGANIHETMIALDKADIATRLTTKIGQKLVQAYKEVSNMQV